MRDFSLFKNADLDKLLIDKTVFQYVVDLLEQEQQNTTFINKLISYQCYQLVTELDHTFYKCKHCHLIVPKYLVAKYQN